MRPYITVLQFDPYGNFTRETLPLNDAILKLLRFARKQPGALCTIELREVEQSADSPWVRGISSRAESATATEKPLARDSQVLEFKVVEGSPITSPISSFERVQADATSENRTDKDSEQMSGAGPTD